MNLETCLLVDLLVNIKIINYTYKCDLEYMNVETCLPVKVVLIFFLRPANPNSSLSSSPTVSFNQVN